MIAELARALLPTLIASLLHADEEVRIAPSDDGRLGAWLIAGPLEANPRGPLERPPIGVDEPHARAARGGSLTPFIRWQVGSSASGPIDIARLLHGNPPNRVAYASGVLHLERAGNFYLLVGADDGVRVTVDGEVVLLREESRPFRDDDDVIALPLAAGDHTLELKLHQRDGGWGFAVRILDATDLAPPRGAFLSLQGTNRTDARALAAAMASFTFDRRISPEGYRPLVGIRFLDGAPIHLQLRAFANVGGAPEQEWVIGPVVRRDDRALPLTATFPTLFGPGTEEQRPVTYNVTFAGQKHTFIVVPRERCRAAIAEADAALDDVARTRPQSIPAASIDTLTALRDRLRAFVNAGDADTNALDMEAAELATVAAAVLRHEDPYREKTGAMRRAYRSPEDGELSEFGLYVPHGARKERKYPLVVALHGWDGKPMSMLRWVFGEDDPSHDRTWEDRHPAKLQDVDAFVVTPDGHANAMYRDLGEADVMRVIDWAVRTYPIDPARVTITGPSMGGIGAASIPLHHPGLFAGAEPLCGYHDYFVRRDIQNRPIRPWERALAMDRSNVEWAENGKNLPLYVVHGTLDIPVENSGSLIRAYEQLRYSVREEHPPLGHPVWHRTYANLAGIDWLLRQKLDLHPKAVRFKTDMLRFGDDAWLHIRGIEAGMHFAEVSARITSDHSIDATTKRVTAIVFDRDLQLLRDGPVSVRIDGATLEFPRGTPLQLFRADDGWHPGEPASARYLKRAGASGPLRDVFFDPVVFVYGASDPQFTRVNEEVARGWAKVRTGVRAKLPIMSDIEWKERGEQLANDRSLFLVGNARSNQLIAALEPDFPIQIDEDAIVMAGGRFSGREIGVAFIRPNRARPDRSIVVVESPSAGGLWRSLSLPDLLPDFVVYDEKVAPARGQMLLGIARVRAAGFFENDWSLPSSFDDVPTKSSWTGPKTEYEATPYLP